MTALHYAAFENNAAAVRMLVAAGAVLEARDVDDFPLGGGITSLWFAARANCYDAAKALLELRASVDGSTLSAPPIVNLLSSNCDAPHTSPAMMGAL